MTLRVLSVQRCRRHCDRHRRATRHLEKFIRVWTLGQGRRLWPVSPLGGSLRRRAYRCFASIRKKSYCGCGGKGHLEGIMGHRAMRLRFLDLEPEEVFDRARRGRPALRRFRSALASRAGGSLGDQHSSRGSRASSLFPDGTRGFVKVGMLSQYLQEMVTMSPLQGSVFEVIPARRRACHYRSRRKCRTIIADFYLLTYRALTLDNVLCN